MMKHYLNQFPNFFIKYSNGTLLGRATNDIDSLSDFSGFGMMTIFDGYVYPIFVVTLMITSTNVFLTLICLIPMVITAFLSTLVGAKFEKNNNEVNESFDKMNDAVLLYSSGILTIRSYNLTQKTFDLYKKAALRYQKAVDDFYRLLSYYMVVGQIMPSISIVLALIFGYYFISTGNFTVGSLLSFIVYVRYLEWPMSAIANSIGNVSAAKVALRRIDEILDEKPLLQDGPISVNHIDTIEFNHFNYEVDNLKILSDINLTIKAGDFIGVVGKTGSGKTTLLKQLLRFNEVESNTLLINNQSIEAFNIKSLRNQMAYVPQEHMLFSKTIKENIAFGSELDNFEEILVHADLKKDVESFIDKEDTVVGEKGIMLSGGQKQRISLARALAKNRPIYILDDCLSALDNATQENILTHLQAEANGKTLLISSHRLSVFKNATKIIVLEEGKIVEVGTHEQLMANKGWYQSQYEYQKAGGNNE